MKKWFQNKKREKQLNSDLRALISVHEKKRPLETKRTEIYGSELTTEEKGTLIDLIEAQLAIIDTDIRTLGLAMSHYFTDSKIDRLVPIGVDLTLDSYDVDEQKVVEYRRNCSYVDFHLVDEQEYSTYANDIANELYEKVSTDGCSLYKQNKLSKMPLKQRVKDKLMRRHTDRDEERKQDVLTTVQMLQSNVLREQREISIIQAVVGHTIDNPDAPDNLLELSKRINLFEDSLVSNDLYKSFLCKDFAHKIFSLSRDLTNPMKVELAENLLFSLNETGYYVITNVAPNPRGSGEMSS